MQHPLISYLRGRSDQASIMKSRSKVILDVQISDSLLGVVDKIAADLKCSRSEVLSRAFALLDVARSANKLGYKVGIADKAGDLDVEFVGI